MTLEEYRIFYLGRGPPATRGGGGGGGGGVYLGSYDSARNKEK